ncbi:hypothetical protein LEP1GSC024_0282 [Leptospira noguchii str. 2001034031]|uniref:Uncharacterized protein n=1 Tax=Leptospira noguchii str. 2001034031 TaxID=1193053 RepID=M6YC91_9LEPT|nr:hypothetical protein LEP1GSC024_0282 [Leptospira noguchii str. 2001034031]
MNGARGFPYVSFPFSKRKRILTTRPKTLRSYLKKSLLNSKIDLWNLLSKDNPDGNIGTEGGE